MQIPMMNEMTMKNAYHAKGSRVIVVKLVNVLIKRTIMKTTVSPVMPEILAKEENSNLNCHGLPMSWSRVGSS
jgi:hypothetical protein